MLQSTNKGKVVINNKVLFALIKFLSKFVEIAGYLFAYLVIFIYKLTGKTKTDILISDLNEKHKNLFPERNNNIDYIDLQIYLKYVEPFKKLFKHYDIVQGYSTSAIYPLLTQNNYFAFEHGTLRSISFENNSTGKLTALAFNSARHIYVTNSDCMQNAQKLSGNSLTFIPHPYNEDRIQKVNGFQNLRKKVLNDLGVKYILFFPTRHDWIPDKGYRDKANDVFLRGFARLCKDQFSIGLIMCEWGNNIKESKTLVTELGISDYVMWKNPMGTIEYERYMLASGIVIDQFLLGAFGGVMFRALSAGKPVCSYIDQNQIIESYGGELPVINCKNEDEIYINLLKYLTDKTKLAEISELSKRWFNRNHSGWNTIVKQVNEYKKTIEI